MIRDVEIHQMIISDPQNGGVASLLPKTLLAQVCVPYRVRLTGKSWPQAISWGNWVILPLCLTEYLAGESGWGWGYRGNLSLSNSNRRNFTLRLSQEKTLLQILQGIIIHHRS